MNALSFTHIDTPIGRLLLAGDGVALHFLSFPSGPRAFGPRPGWHLADTPLFVEVRRQLDAYFAGRLARFDLPLSLTGTPFQTGLWRYLPQIPAGETRSYGRVAADLGVPAAARAIGAANAANPIPIILPCHRVVGSTGSLHGFGGGLPVKAHLLRLEAGVAAGHS